MNPPPDRISQASDLALSLSSPISAFLDQRHAYLDPWFLLVRITLGLGLMGYLAMDAVAVGTGMPVSVMLVGSYLLANFGIRLMGGWHFRQARWAFAALDFLFVLILRHAFQFSILVDPNATFAGLMTLVMSAYALYCDPRLSVSLSLAALAAIIGTFFFETLKQPLPSMAVEGPMLLYRTHPLRALLLFSYLGLVGILSHGLALQLRRQLIEYDEARFQASHAAVHHTGDQAGSRVSIRHPQRGDGFLEAFAMETSTSLQALHLALDFLREELPADAKSSGVLTAATGSAHHLMRLLRDFETFRELLSHDSYDYRANFQMTDLVSVLVEDPETPSFIARGLDKLAVCADPQTTARALQALLRRAEALLPPEHPVTLAGHVEGNSVVLSIHDPASHLEPVFANDEGIGSFHATSAQTAITRLELLLANHAIGRLGGSMQIDSSPDEGTTVHCHFPARCPNVDWLSIDMIRAVVGRATS